MAYQGHQFGLLCPPEGGKNSGLRDATQAYDCVSHRYRDGHEFSPLRKNFASLSNRLHLLKSLQTAFNVLPSLRLPGALDRSQNLRHPQSFGKTGFSLTLFCDRLQELVCFDGFQVLVAQSDTGARIKSRVKRVRRTTHNADRSVVDTVFIRSEYLQFVHAFEIPAERALGTLNLKGKLTLVPLDHPANLQAALHAVSKLRQRSSIVFVGYVAHRTSLSYTEVGADSGCRQRPLS